MFLIRKNKVTHSIRGIIRSSRASGRAATRGYDVGSNRRLFVVPRRVYLPPRSLAATTICRAMLKQRLEMVQAVFYRLKVPRSVVIHQQGANLRMFWLSDLLFPYYDSFIGLS
jgi:hypothetical protein